MNTVSMKLHLIILNNDPKEQYWEQVYITSTDKLVFHYLLL